MRRCVLNTNTLKVKSFFHWPLVLMVVLLTGSPLLEGAQKAVLLIGLVFYLLFRVRIIVRVRERLILFFAISVFFISFLMDVYSAFNVGFNSLSFFYFFTSFVFGYLVTKEIQFYDFMVKYELLIRVLTVISLFFYYLIILYPQILSFFQDYTYYHTTNKTVGVYNYVSSNRNSGFASEPGLFQFFIAIALWWRMINIKKIDIVSMMYCLALITTKSTAGIIILILILIPFLTVRNALLILLSIGFFSGFILDEITYQIEYKLLGSFAFQARLDPLVQAVSVFLQNPFGIGSVKYTLLLDQKGIGAWDSFGQTALRFGIQGLLLMFMFLFFIYRKSISLFLIFFVTFASQGIWLLPLCVSIYFYIINLPSRDWKRKIDIL